MRSVLILMASRALVGTMLFGSVNAYAAPRVHTGGSMSAGAQSSSARRASTAPYAERDNRQKRESGERRALRTEQFFSGGDRLARGSDFVSPRTSYRMHYNERVGEQNRGYAEEDRRSGREFRPRRNRFELSSGRRREYGYGPSYGYSAAPYSNETSQPYTTYAGGYATLPYQYSAHPYAALPYAQQRYTHSYWLPTLTYQTVTRTYTVPALSYRTVEQTRYVPIVKYQAVTTEMQVPVRSYETIQRTEQVPVTVYRRVQQTCGCSYGYQN